jgi:hypothetical protein
MKTLSNNVLLFATLSACALLSGQTFAEGQEIIGANLVAYHGVENTLGASGQVSAEPVAVIGSKLIAYQGVEKTTGSSAEETGSFCSTTHAKNFSAGAVGLLSARASC